MGENVEDLKEGCLSRWTEGISRAS